jgi:hypothetical protein
MKTLQKSSLLELANCLQYLQHGPYVALKAYIPCHFRVFLASDDSMVAVPQTWYCKEPEKKGPVRKSLPLASALLLHY